MSDTMQEAEPEEEPHGGQAVSQGPTWQLVRASLLSRCELCQCEGDLELSLCECLWLVQQQSLPTHKTHPAKLPVLIIHHWVLWFGSMEHSTHDSFLINVWEMNSKSNSKKREEIWLSLWVGTKKNLKDIHIFWTLLMDQVACIEYC